MIEPEKNSAGTITLLLVMFLALLLPLSAREATKPFEKIAGTWKSDRWNDGDSFHVITPGREIVARLYFVDTPECETAYRDRLDEQAAYFGITREQAAQIADEAKAFTSERLSKPFSIWTRWHDALGRSEIGRVYCVVLDPSGRDLAESLVENGLARIYGVRTPLPDGRDSHQYLARLSELEKRAKAAKRGAWRFVGVTTRVAVPSVPAIFVASKRSEVFHKEGCKSAAAIAPQNLTRFRSREEAILGGKRPCAACNP